MKGPRRRVPTPSAIGVQRQPQRFLYRAQLRRLERVALSRAASLGRSIATGRRAPEPAFVAQNCWTGNHRPQYSVARMHRSVEPLSLASGAADP
jgi:hypothetical protein